MESSRYCQIQEVFSEAANLEEPARSRALDRLCGADAELRAAVERLLRGHRESGGFLERPTLADLPGLEGAHGAADIQPLGRVGPYTIVRRLGQGTFGEVYLATQEEPLRRTVALKIIKLGMDTRQVVARFVQESQALAVMDHPHIARVLDAGATETGRPYFVMEVVSGRAVTSFADEHHLSITDRLSLFIQACQAAEHAHSKGVLHRDLKPSNVLASMHDDRPFVKVIDFGVAKATGAVGGMIAGTALHTDNRQFIGTPEYMSPEQALGLAKVGPATDVYALGVILYELLTGVLPYPSDSLRSASYGEMQRIIAEDDPLRPSARLARGESDPATAAARRGTTAAQLVAAVRGDLDCIVMKALEKDPERRYPSAAALASDVTRHMGGLPVVAAPPSTLYRLRKLVRRRRGLVSAGAIVTLVVVAGAAATLWQAHAASKQAGETAKAHVDRERGARIATALRLATLSAQAGPNMPQRRALLAVEAVRATNPADEGVLPQSMQALMDALDGIGGVPVHGHAGGVTAAAFRPDGGALLTASRDGTARLWELRADGTPGACRVLADHTGAVTCASFNRDGTCVLTAGADGTARVWDARAEVAGTPPITLRGHTGPVRTARFIGDGTRVLTASADGTARVWRLTDGDPSASAIVLRGHAKASFPGSYADVRSAVHDAHSDRVATASYDGTIRLWNLADPDPSATQRIVLRENGWCRDVVFDPRGTTLVGCGSQYTHVVWSLQSSEPVRVATLERPDDEHSTFALANSPDGRMLAAAMSDNTVRVYDLRSSEPGEPRMILTGFLAPTRSVAFSPDGRRLLAASQDNSARVWDLAAHDPAASVIVIRGHDDDLTGAWFDARGERVVTASEDGSARLWDLRAPRPSSADRSLAPPPGGRYFAAAFSPDGERLVLAGEGIPVEERALEDLAAVRTIGGSSPSGHWFLATFSPDGRQLALCGKEEDRWINRLMLFLVDPAQARGSAIQVSVPHTLSDPRRMFSHIQWSPVQTILACGDHEGEVCLLALDHEGPPICSAVFRGHREAILDLGFSPDGTRLASASEDGTARVWSLTAADPETASLVLAGHQGYVNTTAFSADGTLLATGGADRTLRIWSLERVSGTSGSPTILRDHGDWVTKVCFTRDGQSMVSGSKDGTVRVWSLWGGHPTGECFTLRAGSAVRSLAISPDSSQAVAVLHDGSVRVWDISPAGAIEAAARVVGRVLTEEERRAAGLYAGSIAK